MNSSAEQSVKFNAILFTRHSEFLDKLNKSSGVGKSTILRVLIDDAIANPSRLNFLPHIHD
jgi:ABC-type nitrate/sulfonate/bicarbonate transport system ATPase subunit